jgi:hypothetical protein
MRSVFSSGKMAPFPVTIATKNSSPITASHSTSNSRSAVRSSCMPRKDKKLSKRAFSFLNLVLMRMFDHRDASFIAIRLHRRQVCVKMSWDRISDSHCWNMNIVSSVGSLNIGASMSDPSFDVSMSEGCSGAMGLSRSPEGVTSDF